MFKNVSSTVFDDDGVLGTTGGDDGSHAAYIAFETNQPTIDTRATVTALLQSVARVVRRYRLRWRIENAYHNIKRVMANTTSRDVGHRFFYFAFACLLYNVRKFVDHLLRADLESDRSAPAVPFMAVVGFIRRKTEIGKLGPFLRCSQTRSGRALLHPDQLIDRPYSY